MRFHSTVRDIVSTIWALIWSTLIETSEANRTNVERLQVLVLISDPILLPPVRAALQDFAVSACYFAANSPNATDALASQHFDGIIFDCNDLVSAVGIVTTIRRGNSNRQSPLIAMVRTAKAPRTIENLGDLWIVDPISDAAIKTQLEKVLDAMQKEHRRYFRYSVSLPLLIAIQEERFVPAMLSNVSADGLAAWSRGLAKPAGACTVRFELPSIEPYQIEAQAEITWADTGGRIGIKLLHIPPEGRRRYSEWLDVLHSQLEFRTLTGESN